jgi:hypothetical protein
MSLSSIHPGGGFDSLSPPKRGEGWGEGRRAWNRFGLLTPTLPVFKGGEGEKLASDLIPEKTGSEPFPAGNYRSQRRKRRLGTVHRKFFVPFVTFGSRQIGFPTTRGRSAAGPDTPVTPPHTPARSCRRSGTAAISNCSSPAAPRRWWTGIARPIYRTPTGSHTSPC